MNVPIKIQMHYLVPFQKSYFTMRRAPYRGSITSQGAIKAAKDTQGESRAGSP
jgi:hypothetical protein